MIVDGNVLMQIIATLSAFACILYTFITIRSDINNAHKTKLSMIFNEQLSIQKKIFELELEFMKLPNRMHQISITLNEIKAQLDTIINNCENNFINMAENFVSYSGQFPIIKDKISEVKDLSQESLDLNKTAFKMYITGGKDKAISHEMNDRVNGIITGIVSSDDESKKSSKK